MESGSLASWVSVLVSILAAAIAIVSARSKATTEKVESLQRALEAKADRESLSLALAKLDLVEDRATRLETHVQHLPDKDAAHRMEMSISSLAGEVRVMMEKIRPIAATCERLQEAMERRQ